MKKKSIIISLFLVIFITLEIISNQCPVKNNPQPTQSSQDVKGESANKNFVLVKVVKVIDGDTIEIEDGRTVRYIGIDTPETVDSRKKIECFGKEASKKNKELVEGKMVKMEKDVSETDKYKRLLRYVWVEDIFVNDYLIKNGYATVATFPPDVKYQEQFKNSQKEAKEKNLGLWSSCSNP